MSYRIQWAPAALRDLDEIIDFIASQDTFQAAERVASKVLDRVQSLKDHPSRCRVVPELKEVGVREYRELILTPYRVFFRITEKTVGIVGVLDGRRDLAETLVRRHLEM